MDKCGPLSKYIKKKGMKAEPFSGEKGGKKLKGPDGIKKDSQYAKKSGGKKVVEKKYDADSEKVAAKPGKEKKRPYLDV